MLTVIMIRGRFFFLFWLHWVFFAALRLSQAVGSGGYSLAVVHRFLIAMASLVAEYRLKTAKAKRFILLTLWERKLQSDFAVTYGLMKILR